jgi:polyferredoxin
MATLLPIDHLQIDAAAAEFRGEGWAQLTPGRPAKITAPRKKLVRRVAPDYSQALRRGFQIAFLLLNVWVGGLFYLWVRHIESGELGRSLARPAGVEGWLPIAGLMNLRYWLATREVPAMHPAAMFLLVTFLSISFLFRKAFCSWLCPVGTFSEYLWRAGRQIFRRNFQLPRWVDVPLRGFKYLLLGFFVWVIANMPAEAVQDFMHSPYGMVADVRMLNFFRYLSETAAIVLGVLVVASALVQNFWCRYLCPYGALLGITSLFSPMRIRRTESACVDCAKCAKACPSALPVDKLVSIKSAECTGCLECVAVCPAEGALELSLPKWTQSPRAGRLPAWAMAAGVAVLFFGIVGFAKTAGYWNTHVPDSVYQQLVPRADEFEHPMPGRGSSSLSQ